ncbi:MucB/RseB C-terminal domain-containing protein [Marinomonas epiphytica]
MKAAFSVCCLILSFLASGFAQASLANSAMDRLDAMTHAFAQLDYEGVFVHSSSKHMNSIRVRHQYLNGTGYESLIDLDGNRIEVLRVGDSVICVYPDKQSASTTVPNLPTLTRFQGLLKSQLTKGYHAILGEQEQRIAGRNAVVIRLQPRDEYRYSHEFWLDATNNFLLKHVTLGLDGSILEQMQFTSVNFSPDLKPNDFVPKKEAYFEHLEEAQLQFAANNWKFDWMPPGFDLVWPDVRVMEQGANMMLISDGMVSLSIFIEPVSQSKPLQFMNMGATRAGEKTIMVNGQRYLLTMVGEVPQATITRLMSVLMPRVKS